MIAIIANPNAHHFDIDALKNIVQELEKNNLKIDVFFTQKAKDGTKIANKIAGRYEIIAAYGGDGIINEIINADLKNSTLGIIPAGTTNVLAIDLKISLNPQKAADLFKKPRSIEAYPALINDKKFILMASAGFDAEAVKNVNEKLKKISGKLSYFAAGIVSYAKSKDKTIGVKIGKKEYEASWVIVSKAKKYAGNFSISKSVDIDVPLFDVCMFRPILNNWIDLPYDNFALFSNLHLSKPPFVEHIITDENIEIEQSNIQIDGDFFGCTKASIKICKKPIRIVVG